MSKYFGTDGIRGKVGSWPITPEFVLKLGWAVGKVLARSGYGKVLIGKDTRISGYMLESVLEAGLCVAGVDVHLLGPMPTPGIAYLTRTLHAQAGIVISASHNPFYDNGIKFFSAEGYKLSDELELAIEQQLELPMTTVDSAGLGRAMRVVDASRKYIEFCKSTIPSTLKFTGLKIVIDCANGATYQIAPSVFRECGADVLEIGVTPNGLNINLDCGATHPETIQAAVIKEKADIGIALDGDGDRLIMVDHLGNILDGDELLHIIVKHHLELGVLESGVVGTVMANFGLEKVLKTAGIEFVRVPVGDRHIMDGLLQRKWYLGGEPSGHIICTKESTTGDGIIAALQVLSAMKHRKQTLAELKVGFKRYPQEVINVRVTKKEDPNLIPSIQNAINDVKQQLENKGRVILRRSGTESVVRVMVEGENANQVMEFAQHLAKLVKTEIG